MNDRLVDLPKDMPDDVYQDLKKMKICGQRLNLSRAGDGGKQPFKGKGAKPHAGKGKGGARKKK